MDALTHPGPAKPRRVSRSICSQLASKEANPLRAHADDDEPKDTRGILLVVCGSPCNTIGAPMATREPALARYVFAR
jgi:hypothetical protein